MTRLGMSLSFTHASQRKVFIRADLIATLIKREGRQSLMRNVSTTGEIFVKIQISNS